MVRLLIAFMRLIAPWPLPVLRALGWLLGMLLCAFAHARRHVVRVNLRHCFPALSDAERSALLRQHFVQVGQSLMDRAWLWHAPLRTVRERLQWTGAVAQLEGDTPTVIFAPHFVGLDAGGLALTLHSATPVAFIYVTQSNPDLEQWVNQGRERGGPVKPYFRSRWRQTESSALCVMAKNCISRPTWIWARKIRCLSISWVCLRRP